MKSFTKRIAAAFLFVLLIAGKSNGETSIPAVRGTIDATHWDLQTPFALNGYWAFYDQQLLTPAECFPFRGTYTVFPSSFADSRASKSGLGYATYALRVILPRKDAGMALQIPQMYNAYILWVNGVKVASAGTVGQTRETTVPQWINRTVTILPADTLDIVLQISNFHHYIGGIREPIHLGPASTLQANTDLTLSSSLAHGIFLIAEALVLFGLFAFRYPKKIIIFFAMLCFTWGLRAFFSLSYPITCLLPDFNWTIAVKIEYFTLFGLMIWGTLFINQLFRESSNRLFQNVLLTVNILLIVFILLSPPLLFTRWLSLYLIFIGITMIYIVAVVLRAALQEQVGVWFLVTSISLGIIIIGYEIATYQNVLPHNPAVTSIGYTTIFIMLTIALLLHLAIIKNKGTSRNILTYKDLYDIQPEKKPAR